MCKLKGEPFISALRPDQHSLNIYLESLGFQLTRLGGESLQKGDEVLQLPAAGSWQLSWLAQIARLRAHVSARPPATCRHSNLCTRGISSGRSGAPRCRARTAREMVQKQLPHVQWDDELPPIMACYGYAEVEKPGQRRWLGTAACPVQPVENRLTGVAR